MLGGIHLGYNIQRGAMVYGLEGDLSFMRFKDSLTDAPSSNTENLSTRVNMLASVRARLGIAVNRGLFYSTGGIAIPRVKSSIYNSGDQGHYRFNKIGGVLGVGYEWAATNQWRWRMEALHYVFNEKKDISNLHSGNPGEAYRLKNATTIRLGISRYFSY